MKEEAVLKYCWRCQETKLSTDFYSRTKRCKPCDAVYRKEKYSKTPEKRKIYYAKSKRYIDKYPERQRARALVSQALVKGTLIKADCRDCGSSKAYAHHPDWTKP